MKNLRNSVQLIGRLGKDPEFRELNDGKMKASFSIATSETYKNQMGEKVEETQWHQVIVWGKLAKICSEFLQKGNEVALEGKLIHRTYETNAGEKRFVTEINMNEMLMFGGKNPD